MCADMRRNQTNTKYSAGWRRTHDESVYAGMNDVLWMEFRKSNQNYEHLRKP